MLITQMKPVDEILQRIDGAAAVISCEGCREVYYPETEAAQMMDGLHRNGYVTAAVAAGYICNPGNLLLLSQKYKDEINAADALLVISCGVGVQTVAEGFAGKAVVAACDTYPLPGHQGLTPSEHDCAQCGECHMNQTGGICPITACSKGLLNGQCGGAKNGMCEVFDDMQCGWELIYKRLEALKMLEALRQPVRLRNYIGESK